MLGLLALLAVAGAFLILGLLSGYLRVSERVAEAEIVKTVADGLDTGLEIVDQPGHRALSQPRPAAPHRQTRRQARDARGAVRRRARLRASLLPPQPRGRARRAARGGVPRALAHRRGGAQAAGCGLRVRPFPAPDGAATARLTLWQVTDVTRERTPRDRDRERAGVDARLLRQPAAGPVRRDAGRAPRPCQRHAVAMAARCGRSRAAR